MDSTCPVYPDTDNGLAAQTILAGVSSYEYSVYKSEFFQNNHPDFPTTGTQYDTFQPIGGPIVKFGSTINVDIPSHISSNFIGKTYINVDFPPLDISSFLQVAVTIDHIYTLQTATRSSFKMNNGNSNSAISIPNVGSFMYDIQTLPDQVYYYELKTNATAPSWIQSSTTLPPIGILGSHTPSISTNINFGINNNSSPYIKGGHIGSKVLYVKDASGFSSVIYLSGKGEDTQEVVTIDSISVREITLTTNLQHDHQPNEDVYHVITTNTTVELLEGVITFDVVDIKNIEQLDNVYNMMYLELATSFIQFDCILLTNIGDIAGFNIGSLTSPTLHNHGSPTDVFSYVPYIYPDSWSPEHYTHFHTDEGSYVIQLYDPLTEPVGTHIIIQDTSRNVETLQVLYTYFDAHLLYPTGISFPDNSSFSTIVKTYLVHIASKNATHFFIADGDSIDPGDYLIIYGANESADICKVLTNLETSLSFNTRSNNALILGLQPLARGNLAYSGDVNGTSGNFIMALGGKTYSSSWALTDYLYYYNINDISVGGLNWTTHSLGSSFYKHTEGTCFILENSVLCVGGLKEDGTLINFIQFLHLPLLTLNAGSSLSHAHSGMAIAKVPYGGTDEVYFFGGRFDTFSDITRKIWKYNIGTNKLDLVTGPDGQLLLTTGRYSAYAETIGNLIFVFGGKDSNDDNIDGVEVFRRETSGLIKIKDLTGVDSAGNPDPSVFSDLGTFCSTCVINNTICVLKETEVWKFYFNLITGTATLSNPRTSSTNDNFKNSMMVSFPDSPYMGYIFGGENGAVSNPLGSMFATIDTSYTITMDITSPYEKIKYDHAIQTPSSSCGVIKMTKSPSAQLRITTQGDTVNVGQRSIFTVGQYLGIGDPIEVKQVKDITAGTGTTGIVTLGSDLSKTYITPYSPSGAVFDGTVKALTVDASTTLTPLLPSGSTIIPIQSTDQVSPGDYVTIAGDTFTGRRLISDVNSNLQTITISSGDDNPATTVDIYSDGTTGVDIYSGFVEIKYISDGALLSDPSHEYLYALGGASTISTEGKDDPNGLGLELVEFIFETDQYRSGFVYNTCKSGVADTFTYISTSSPHIYRFESTVSDLGDSLLYEPEDGVYPDSKTDGTEITWNGFKLYVVDLDPVTTNQFLAYCETDPSGVDPGPFSYTIVFKRSRLVKYKPQLPIVSQEWTELPDYDGINGSTSEPYAVDPPNFTKDNWLDTRQNFGSIIMKQFNGVSSENGFLCVFGGKVNNGSTSTSLPTGNGASLKTCKYVDLSVSPPVWKSLPTLPVYLYNMACNVVYFDNKEIIYLTGGLSVGIFNPYIYVLDTLTSTWEERPLDITSSEFTNSSGDLTQILGTDIQNIPILFGNYNIFYLDVNTTIWTQIILNDPYYGVYGGGFGLFTSSDIALLGDDSIWCFIYNNNNNSTQKIIFHTTPVGHNGWVQYLPFALIDYVELKIGNSIINKLPGDWLFLQSQLFLDKRFTSEYIKTINLFDGNPTHQAISNITSSPPDGYENLPEIENGYTTPLSTFIDITSIFKIKNFEGINLLNLFSFTHQEKNSPLRINIKLRPLNELILSEGSPKPQTNYTQLDHVLLGDLTMTVTCQMISMQSPFILEQSNIPSFNRFIQHTRIETFKEIGVHEEVFNLDGFKGQIDNIFICIRKTSKLAQNIFTGNNRFLQMYDKPTYNAAGQLIKTKNVRFVSQIQTRINTYESIPLAAVLVSDVKLYEIFNLTSDFEIYLISFSLKYNNNQPTGFLDFDLLSRGDFRIKLIMTDQKPVGHQIDVFGMSFAENFSHR
ncbi:MAG: hypothetical protein CMM25_02825 [Rhodospirillaceae bacterium]|nr:hypothetical protein [Rhodospirillaceae bacterium]